MLAPKYRALFIFSLFTLNNGFAWLMFDPVSSWLSQHVVGMTPTQVKLVSSWQPLVFLALAIPIMRLLTSDNGLLKAVKIGAGLEVVGASLKLLGALLSSHTAGLAFLHIGQMFCGVGSPVATGSVSGLSAQWFEPEERTRATSIAVLANIVGNALVYLVVPFLTHRYGFVAVTLYELTMGVVAVLLVFLFFPAMHHGQEGTGEIEQQAENTATPQQPPEPVEEKPLIPEVKRLLSFSSVIMLYGVYAWSSGGFAAWVSLFEATFHTHYSATFIGFMCFCGMMSFVIGGLVVSSLTEMYFPRQMKYCIFFCLACNAVSCLMFLASVPDDGGNIMWDFGKPWILFVTSCCGFFNGGAAPLFYELVAEISFPVEESVSGIGIAVCENVGALFFYQGVARIFKGLAMNVSYSAGMVVAVAIMSEVRQDYKRMYYANAMKEYLEQTEEVEQMEDKSAIRDKKA